MHKVLCKRLIKLQLWIKMTKSVRLHIEKRKCLDHLEFMLIFFGGLLLCNALWDCRVHQKLPTSQKY